MRPADPTTPCHAGRGLRAPRGRRLARRVLLATAGAAATAIAAPATPAIAADGGGATISISAASQANSMVVRKISCLRGCSSISSVKAGATLRFQGPLLTRGKRVVYLGGAGEADDVKAQLRVKKSGKSKLATALVPKRAKSGPVAIEITDDARSPASASRIQLPAPPQAVATLAGNGPFFPIRGAYTFGTNAGVFGPASGRVHEGWDLFAKCGTPLVAAEGGKVLYEASHSRAGNYIVIDVSGGDHDIVYMHMQAPSPLKAGATVTAGQQVGNVGDTGRVSGCHLHFELWKGVWRGLGGKKGEPIDPLPTLKAWAAADTSLRAARKR